MEYEHLLMICNAATGKKTDFNISILKELRNFMATLQEVQNSINNLHSEVDQTIAKLAVSVSPTDLDGLKATIDSAIVKLQQGKADRA